MDRLLSNLIYFYEMYIDFQESPLEDMPDLKQRVLSISMSVLNYSDIKPSEYIKTHSNKRSAELMIAIENLEKEKENA